jgi:hypothetical protein
MDDQHFHRLVNISDSLSEEAEETVKVVRIGLRIEIRTEDVQNIVTCPGFRDEK